ncbi:MAG TPA: carboxypeptidase-like regulatory domain-containing protein [Bryobacteraceae bacterium]|nr:carboxypeptidase-like regulatory domain-containing protein [Bryobacteraceae bacterium]
MLTLKRLTPVLILIACLGIAAPAGFGQSIFGTLTGIVSDSSQAVVPGATVTVKNDASGDIRKTQTNADGYFTVASLPAGNYTVSVEASGFIKWERTGIEFTGADKRNLNDIVLQIGTTSEKVEVVSSVEQITPVDSGEKSAVLTTKQLQDFSVVGRSAAEFIKVLPGMAIAGTGVENRANFTGEVIGINGNGDGGSQSALNNAFSVNGLPTNSLDITADGAHVSDPGCNCATPVNPNTDMIQEFKVLTSNFSAENSKGPAVINTIAKAGGRDFHGEGYFYARHFAMNADDWLNNATNTRQPENKYFFPGGNIGGPILIPGTNINRNRDKLFFFTGYEYYYQTLDTGILTATVPTADMLGGNFSPSALAALGTKTASGGAPSQLNATQFPGGIIPASQIDPGGQALLKLLPTPNADPNATGGYNWVKDEAFNQNGWQWLSRVDYSISDNTKLFVRYNLQNELQQFPIGLWWRNGNQVPYPTPIDGRNQSQSISASLTHVFSPTLTNEFVFGHTFITFPNVFHDPKKVDRTALGYPYQGVYHNGTKQIPSFLGWGGEFATLFNPGGFEAGGSKGLFADKYLPSVSDNVSKVWGTHTMKFGFYYEFVINDQPANGYTNGLIVEANWAGGSSGNPYSDLLLGRAGQYQEQNVNPLHNEAYHTTEFFGQDSWKISRKVTLEYGLRISHLGPWYDRQGIGFAVWNPASYSSTAAPTDYTGLLWHKRNASIPLSGFPSRALFYAPRFGVAWDIFGTGKTVLRGGWGQFYYHNAQFTTGLDAPAGVQTKAFNSLTTLAQIDATDAGVGAIGTDALNRTDDQTPRTRSYSFSVSQRLPGSSLLEVSYVGNQSDYQLNNGGVGTNINAVPYGTLLHIGTDPNASGFSYDSYRPFPLYQDLHAVNHNLYSNYNAMQISWNRQRGRFDFTLNYAFSKSMGIVGLDQFNLANDYGPSAADRRHVFNSAYSIELPNPAHNNALAKVLVNGWQLSGITQLQSGINLVPNSSNADFNIGTNGFKLADGENVSSRTINGTDSVPLLPLVTCNPGSNRGSHQFVNGSCFALPSIPGGNGPIVMPEIFGPWFFNSDLSLFKNHQFSESKKLQLRFSAYNFMNHPLWSFRNGSNNLNLNFDGTTGQLANDKFGIATEKLGHRIIQLAIKFYF